MKIFATFDTSGAPTGFYPEDVFPLSEDGTRNAGVPGEAIEITVDTYVTLRDNQNKRFIQGVFSDYVPPPPNPVPVSVTRRQFLLALYNYDGDATTYNKVVNWVNAHASDYPPIKIEFDNALYFYRSNNVFAAAAADTSLGITDDDIDAVFIAADKIAD